MKIKVLDYVKNNKFVSLLITLAVVGFIVWTVYLNSDWIGFWGSIIGSSLGVIGVFATMRWDQKKREEERKQDIFLSNKEVYIELITTLKKSNISAIASDLNKLKQSEDWHSFNKETKVQIDRILSESNKVDENEGLKTTLNTFIVKNLVSEFTESGLNRGDEMSENALKHYAIDGLLTVLHTKIKNQIEYVKDMEEVLKTHEDFKKVMSQFDGLSSFTKNSENIYYSLLNLFDSNIWKSYIGARKELFQLLNNLKKELVVKLEEVHR